MQQKSQSKNTFFILCEGTKIIPCSARRPLLDKRKTELKVGNDTICGLLAFSTTQAIPANFYQKVSKGKCNVGKGAPNSCTPLLKLHSLCALCADFAPLVVKKTPKHTGQFLP
jgi:hypothetical protein